MTRARGALLGAVVGDAFGAPLEGMSPNDARAAAVRRARGSEPWRYTDDGAMFIAIAESLRDTGTVHPVSVLSKLAAHYEPARGFGRGMKLALAAYESGVSWQRVAGTAWPEGSRGNGGAVRAGAVALRAWSTVNDLTAATRLATRVTHAHADALELAVLQAQLVSLTLENPQLLDDPHATLDELARRAPATPLIKDVILRVRQTCDVDVDIALSCGTSPLARESVAAAHAAFLRVHDSVEAAVVHAATLGGDVDSICCMVGCLAGALHGESQIPAYWLAALSSETPSIEALSTLADVIANLPAIAFSEHATVLTS